MPVLELDSVYVEPVEVRDDIVAVQCIHFEECGEETVSRKPAPVAGYVYRYGSQDFVPVGSFLVHFGHIAFVVTGWGCPCPFVPGEQFFGTYLLSEMLVPDVCLAGRHLVCRETDCLAGAVDCLVCAQAYGGSCSGVLVYEPGVAGFFLASRG